MTLVARECERAGLPRFSSAVTTCSQRCSRDRERRRLRASCAESAIAGLVAERPIERSHVKRPTLPARRGASTRAACRCPRASRRRGRLGNRQRRRPRRLGAVPRAQQRRTRGSACRAEEEVDESFVACIAAANTMGLNMCPVRPSPPLRARCGTDRDPAGAASSTVAFSFPALTALIRSHEPGSHNE
jgi:hypothetical protein